MEGDSPTTKYREHLRQVVGGMGSASALPIASAASLRQGWDSSCPGARWLHEG